MSSGVFQIKEHFSRALLPLRGMRASPAWRDGKEGITFARYPARVRRLAVILLRNSRRAEPALGYTVLRLRRGVCRVIAPSRFP